MRPEILDIWVKALRSDEFQQTKGFLHDKRGYCCLGVLCELHRRETNGKTNWSQHDQCFTYDGEPGALPPVVCKWAGLRHSNPIIDSVIDCDLTAAQCNDDGGQDFKTIAAKLIKAQKKGLL